MKKKSILLTCIVALMALAMFVGCDSTPAFPDMPKSVKGGYLTQTGVILTGQEATADKFTLTVEYDNGDEPTVMPATNIQLDGEGNVFAVAGLDSDNTEVMTQKLVVDFTDANRIEATGFKESYTVAEAQAIKPSDLQVKAFYEGGEMNLTSSEFTVTYDSTVLVDSLVSPSHPTEQVEITVHPTVGVSKKANETALDETYVITVKYEEAVKPEYAIKSVDKVKFADGAIIKGLAYDEVPAPSFDDVEFIVTYDNDVQSPSWVKLTEESGVVLNYVDSGTKLDLIKKNLVGDTGSYTVKAVYNDEPVYFEGEPKSVTQVKEVQVTPVEGYKAPTFKEGQAFEAPVSEDFDVVLAYTDGSYERLNAAAKEEVVFSYINTADEKPVDEFVAGTRLIVKAEYKGVYGYTSQVITVQPKDAAVPVEITDVKLVAGYNAPAKQHYNNVGIINSTLAINAIESIAVKYEGVEESAVVKGFTADNLEVEYSLTSGSVTELDKDSLADVDTIYIHGTWSYVNPNTNKVEALEFYEPVELPQAYASDIKVSVDYDKTSYDGKPMYGTTYDFTVEAVNANGVVSTLAADEYTIDGILPETVTKTATVPVNAFIMTASGEELATDDLILTDPVAYVSIDNLTLAVGEGEVVTPYLVGSKTADHFTDDTAKKYVVTGYTAHGNATVKIRETDVFALPFSTVKEGSNTIYAYVSYVDENGRTQNNVRVSYTFNGVSYVAPTNGSTFTITYNGDEYTSGSSTFPAVPTAKLADFKVSGFTKFGTVVDPTIKDIKVADQYSVVENGWTEGFSIGNGVKLEFTISYINGLSAEPAEATVTFTSVSV